jgi:hypothetical protein
MVDAPHVGSLCPTSCPARFRSGFPVGSGVLVMLTPSPISIAAAIKGPMCSEICPQCVPASIMGVSKGVRERLALSLKRLKIQQLGASFETRPYMGTA